MSKIKDSITDVPVNDTDYDYINQQENMVGVSEEEKEEGDILSFSPEE